jgi:cytochrome c peroxidase
MKNKIGLVVVALAILAAGVLVLRQRSQMPNGEAGAPLEPTSVSPAEVAAIRPDAVKAHFAALPTAAENPANPFNAAKVALGRSLFFDPRLSKSGFISCNSCHNLASGGVDGLPTSVGHRWQIGSRNAPTVLNAALHIAQFWDGRAADVEQHAGMRVLNPREMAMPSGELVIERLGSIPDYVAAFKDAYPGETDPLNYQNVAKAIAVFERTLLTPSRFDKFLAGDAQALSPQEKAGLKKFVDTGCVTCHNGAVVGGNMYQKFGVVRKPESLTDPGRFEVTKNEADRYVFKVPSLRNIALTAPYFHDGSVWVLEEAIQIMADVQAGKKLGLEETASIAKFLRALSADPPLQVILPSLPASTSKTPKPSFN